IGKSPGGCTAAHGLQLGIRPSPCFAAGEGGSQMVRDRRSFLFATAGLGIAAGPTRAQVPKDKQKKDEPEEEISATEDLMREHGVLNRIVLVFEEGLRRLRGKDDVPPEVFHKPATLVRRFIEDYHEKLEEKFIFPPFEKAKRLTDLVTALRAQH